MRRLQRQVRFVPLGDIVGPPAQGPIQETCDLALTRHADVKPLQRQLSAGCRSPRNDVAELPKPGALFGGLARAHEFEVAQVLLCEVVI